MRVITVIRLIVMLSTRTTTAQLFICLGLRPQHIHSVGTALAYFDLWRRHYAIFGTWSAQVFIHDFISVQ